MRGKGMRAYVAALAFGLSLPAPAMSATMTWPQLLERPRPAPTRTIAYGADPLQHVDLWLPSGRPPFPVVLMVHGGCWQTDVAGADIMNWIADDLRRHGIAVWNVEYRGVDRPGGGYPGTFEDAAAAADLLGKVGPVNGMDTRRVVAFGHSAGGHLALWLASRSRVPASSPLHTAHPLPIALAISAGGLPDLAAASTPPGDTCGVDPVRRLTGSPSPERPDVYRDTSPAAMMPVSVPTLLINGAEDRIAPPAFATAYAGKAAASGRALDRLTIPAEGHVELIAPETAAWAAARRAISAAFAPPHP